MKVTEVKVRKKLDNGPLKGVVSITIDDCFVIHDIKVIDGTKGLFIAMPSRKSGDGVFRDVAHPLNTEVREYLKETILQKYNEVIATEEYLEEQEKENE